MRLIGRNGNRLVRPSRLQFECHSRIGSISQTCWFTEGRLTDWAWGMRFVCKSSGYARPNPRNRQIAPEIRLGTDFAIAFSR